ncbi:MAG: polysaccharide pyruvyl transferase family protein [Pseudomonadota bacterium]
MTILGTNGSLDHKHGSSASDMLRFSGGNTGNLLFQYAASELISNQKKYVGIAALAYSDPTAFKDSRYFVFPAANHLRTDVDWSGLAGFIDSRRVPLVMLGLGAQAASNPTNDEVQRISEHAAVQELASVIRDKGVLVTVRGKFSKRVCDQLGIESEVFGCPSLFLNPDPKLGESIYRQLAFFKENPGQLRPAVTAAAPFELADEERRRRLEGRLYGWVIENDGLYVQQSGGDDVIAFTMNPQSKAARKTAKAVRTLLAPDVSLNRFTEGAARVSRVYWNARRWIDELKETNLAIGTRLHGNMAALASGIPGVFISHDARTDELIETMKVPYLPLEEVPDRLSDVFERVRFDPVAFDENRAQLFRQFAERMGALGLTIDAQRLTTFSSSAKS